MVVPSARERGERTILGVPVRTLCLFVLFLSALDSAMSAQVLAARRGVELNPVMAWLFDAGGVLPFVAVKVLLTLLCLLWVTRRASWAHVRLTLFTALAIYLPIAGLHIANSHRLMV